MYKIVYSVVPIINYLMLCLVYLSKIAASIFTLFFFVDTLVSSIHVRTEVKKNGTSCILKLSLAVCSQSKSSFFKRKLLLEKKFINQGDKFLCCEELHVLYRNTLLQEVQMLPNSIIVGRFVSEIL